MSCCRNTRANRLCLVTALLIAFGSAVSAQTMQTEPARADANQPLIGCGKAQALAQHFHHDAQPLPPRILEAMQDTDVLHNAIDIEVSNLDPGNNNCYIAGSNRMTIKSKANNLAEFTFRLRSQFTITSALVNDTLAVPVSSISTTTRLVDLSSLSPSIGLDEIFTLTIAYEGTSVSAGFGSIRVATHSGGTPVVSTLSEAYYAYTWWPTKDGDVFEPGNNADKATLDFSITVPDGFSVPANGLLLSEETLPGSRTKFSWRSDYPLPPYLVAFAATEYNRWTSMYDHPGGSMPVDFFIYPGNDSPANRAAWERCIDMLHVFRPLFGEYPFINEKYGLYNFPFSGGMEHQTITGQSGFGERLTAHELGHQWWGDMVTCKTWSDIWLNEGFATYSECLWEEYKNGSPDPGAYQACMASERPTSVNGSCYVPPEDTSSMSRIFSSNYSYRKGAWVLHQLRHVIGDGLFFQVLADYRAAYAYSAATTNEFVTVASATVGEDLAWFFDQWVYQIGAPSYRYGWTTTQVNGRQWLLVSIIQDQSPSYPETFIMPVDLEATIGGSPETLTIWNDARSEWFVLPVDGAVGSLSFDPEDWILRTAAVGEPYVAGPPKIVAVDPVPGSTAALGQDAVTIWFHTPVDLSPDDLALVGQSTGPRSFTTATTSGANPVTLLLDEPLAADQYTLLVADAIVASSSGLALDGEITTPASAAALPSGDGSPGGQAIVHFDVACIGDINHDDAVNLRDFSTLQRSFGMTLATYETGDLDGDGNVDLVDLGILIDAMGTDCTAQ